jgi:SNF2 family DNA or RNA helicase
MQYASSYATVEQGIAEGATHVRLSEPSSKLDELDELLQELGWKWQTKTSPAKEGLPLVVFAESRQLIMLAAARAEKHGLRHWILAGGMTDDLRDRYVMEFASGAPGVMYVVIKAGGEGIDLVRARHCVFLQRSWSMLANKQAEDRIHRIGSEVHDSVEIIDIIAPGTVEVAQVERVHEKLRRLEEINRDRERIRAAGGDTLTLDNEEATIMASDVMPRSMKEEG